MDRPPSSAKSQQQRFQENEKHPTEVSFLISQPLEEELIEGPSASGPVLFRHDSEFSVGSNYEYSSPNNLSVWQGAALLTADCLGTGILALPGDIQVLGYGLGLGFLIANLPINFFAGTILSHVATHVEDRQRVENRLYQESVSGSLLGEGGDIATNESINADTMNSKESVFTFNTQQTQHTQLHHDTATFDFIGMTQALFRNKVASRLVMVRAYTMHACGMGVTGARPLPGTVF
jgi:hypothetical protein